jgi:hypothetical protein
LLEFADKPVFGSVQTDSEGKKSVIAYGVDQYLDTIGPFTPIIQRRTGSGNESKPNYFAISSFIRNPVVTDLNFAATFQSQAHLFIADAILKRAATVTTLHAIYENKQQQRRADKRRETMLSQKRQQLAKALMARQRDGKDYCHELGAKLEYDRQYKKFIAIDRFSLTAGSYLCGGKYPPHNTHRDGIHFDIGMGPDLMPWQTSKATAFLALAYPWLAEKGALQYTREQMVAGIFDNGKYRGVYDIYDVNHVPKDTCSKKLRVTHSFMRDYKNAIFDHLNGITNDKSFNEAENILLGTPHFQNAEDGELAHVGHICVLLSGPYRIVYASAIVHLRALRAVNQAARKLDESDDGGEERRGRYVEAVKALEESCDFAFLPHNHHHHWHVYYWKKEEQKHNDVSAFSRHRELWLMLGIDLRGLAEYLERYSDVYLLPATIGYSDAKAARDALVRFLESYNEEFVERYEGAEGESKSQTSDAFVRSIFAPVISHLDGSLVKPVAGPPKRVSKLDNGTDSMFTHGTRLKKHLSMMLELYNKNKDDTDASRQLAKIKEEISRSFSFKELREREVAIDPEYWEEALMYEIWGLEDEAD